MPRQCEGYSKPRRAPGLVRCEYDAMPDGRFCYFHEKVWSGDITGVSWTPNRKEDRKPDPLEVLREEWGL